MGDGADAGGWTEQAGDEAELREACGVFGCVAQGEWPSQLDVAHIIALGLVALQHRGQESAGIVTSNGATQPRFTTHKGMGLVSSVVREEDLVKLRQGNLGIGHTRYSTAGHSELLNCQPFVVETLHGKIAVAHNGELVNAAKLRRKVLRHGVGLSSTSDSELITQLLALTPPGEEPHGPDWVAAVGPTRRLARSLAAHRSPRSIARHRSLTRALVRSFTRSLTKSLTQCRMFARCPELNRSLTHSLTHPLARWLTHPLAHSPTRSLTQRSPTRSLAHSPTRSLTHSLDRSLILLVCSVTYLLTHPESPSCSLAQSPSLAHPHASWLAQSLSIAHSLPPHARYLAVTCSPTCLLAQSLAIAHLFAYPPARPLTRSTHLSRSTTMTSSSMFNKRILAYGTWVLKRG
ncbi:amidophosphoribosyltransferase isoform X1 [Lethenteron reissneri]|uniref:amidophosphoribosyltransferase isoform X1 n=1 Tax=Lethenteron reissneri TaxID=7753 RepID=UPI002AB68BC8|nr:amidophosphoribosyltransferase isoform X1 [Lethenteron reissneri]XP_061408492.1 amidophosphoribosyltransferase isoform X1 [Lethenteron reissneri]XP_061408493.1 amidophosphoribosyltransferase isoform X1 [Lethenteron reissneri]XP_061408494.1 amidophosphoribosyltransferase isoform X1 [Lethenteron reissneri]XP_061408495.1 amidophosphoribosyltransferase isoform X1 [Lethenteron reissneri]